MLISAERVLIDGTPRADMVVDVDASGRIARLGTRAEIGDPHMYFKRRLLVPGMVNAHSHAFQRLLRGRTQVSSANDDDFWTWREVMYRVGSRLGPSEVFAVTRQAFLELLLAGVTTVGEFHYLHHQPGGAPYARRLELAEAVLRAARETGIRLCLLRTVYLRGDFEAAPSELQARFCDATVDMASADIEALRQGCAGDPKVTIGVAPHSIRALPIEAIVALKQRWPEAPFHMHAAEQPREVERCVAAYGVGPVKLFADRGVLDARTTLVHCTHLRDGEVELIAAAKSTVCMCPTTEADLGDGLGPAGELFRAGVPVAVGSDGQTFLSMLEEARRLEMHERLKRGRRNVLARGPNEAIARALFACATENGARALGLDVGRVAVGAFGDFVTFDIDDPALNGSDDASLLATLLFSGDTRAVRDVLVGGELVVRDRVHAAAAATQKEYREISRRLFADAN